MAKSNGKTVALRAMAGALFLLLTTWAGWQSVSLGKVRDATETTRAVAIANEVRIEALHETLKRIDKNVDRLLERRCDETIQN